LASAKIDLNTLLKSKRQESSGAKAIPLNPGHQLILLEGIAIRVRLSHASLLIHLDERRTAE